jgi:hypothetical protein
VADVRRFPLPADARGELEVLVGLYDPADPDLAPLPVGVTGAPAVVRGDRVRVGVLQVRP